METNGCGNGILGRGQACANAQSLERASLVQKIAEQVEHTGNWLEMQFGTTLQRP